MNVKRNVRNCPHPETKCDLSKNPVKEPKNKKMTKKETGKSRKQKKISEIKPNTLACKILFNYFFKLREKIIIAMDLIVYT